MDRQARSLWTYVPAQSMFLYYFVGALALIFCITVSVTKALRRKKSQVVELLGYEDFKEPSVSCLVAITTSSRFGAGCPNHVKVFMQMVGDRNASPYFTLRADKGRRPLLKRGYTDIFLVKVKESVGQIEKVKLVVSGIDRCLKWRISRLHLYDPRSDERRDLPVSVLATETLEDPELKNVMLKKRSASDCWRSIITYHQWLSRIGTTIRFGAFSEIVHVLFLFLSILTLLIFSLIFYITFPNPDVDTETFSLNYASFAISSSLSALACFCICFVLEVVMRRVRSREKDLNYAYYSLKGEDAYKDSCRPDKKSPFGVCESEAKIKETTAASDFDMGENKQDENQMFVLKLSVCDTDLSSSKEWFFDDSGKLQFVRKIETDEYGIEVPSYIRNLDRASMTSHHQEEVEGGQELDKKLSLAIINSATSWAKEAIAQKNLAAGGSVVDAETGEQVVGTRKGAAKVKKNVSSGTNVEKLYHPLDASESKFGMTVMNKMSKYLGKLFGKSNRKEGVLSEKNRGKQAQAPKVIPEPKSNFVVINESKESMIEIKIPQLDTPTSTDDEIENVQKSKRKTTNDDFSATDKENQEKSAGGMFSSGGPLAAFGRYVLGTKADDVKIEISSGEQDESVNKTLKHDKAESSRYKTEFVAINIPSEEGKKDLASKSVKAGHSMKRTPSEESGGLREKLAEPSEQKNKDLIMQMESFRKHVKIKDACWEIEDSIKTWARNFIQDLLMKFRSYRDSTAEGYVTFQMTWFEVLDWVHEVMFMISNCLVYKMKQDIFMKDTFQSLEIQNFLGHASAEVILIAVDGVSSYLHNEGKNSLADLLLLSHHVMQGISHVTDGLVYYFEVLEKNGETYRLNKILSELDVESDLKYVSTKFLRDCATWTFRHGSLSWPFIKKLIPTGDENINKVQEKVSSLVVLSAIGGAEKYSEEGFVSSKLIHFMIEEAQEEVWVEFHNEQVVFTNILVKLRILESLAKRIEAIDRKKRFLESLINKHDQPKSRVQKRMEKRLAAERANKEGQSLKKKKTHFKDPWKIEMSKKKYSDWIREVGALVRSMLILCKIKQLLEKRWTKQGLQLHMRADNFLAQALLHPYLAESEDDLDGYWFENFLHYMRAESVLAGYLVETADHLVKLITHDAIIKAALRGAAGIERIIEEIVVKTDIGVQILTEDEDNILVEVMRLEIIQEAEDEAVEVTWSQQFSPQNVAEQSTHAEDDQGQKRTDKCQETIAAKERVEELMLEKGLVRFHGMMDDSNVFVIDINQSAKMEELKEPSEIATEHQSKTHSKKKLQWFDEKPKEDIIQTMLSVFKPLKSYIAYMKREEILRDRTALQHYLKKSERKRQRACALNYQRLLDSYYIIEEEENNPSHTKESLYQLEYDLMGETVKPLPRFTKKVVICIMVVMILFSFIYVGLVAGQLTTTETQEWICYYLLSVAAFGFVLEPVRAILVGLLVK